MLRSLPALAAVLLATGLVLADDVKGKISSVDSEKGTITLSVDGKDQTLTVEKSAMIQAPGKKKMLTDVPGGLSGLKTGDEATATVETKDGKMVVTRIITAGGKKKKTN
jgi:hypothetical protein